jgi:hypothetical protein
MRCFIFFLLTLVIFSFTIFGDSVVQSDAEVIANNFLILRNATNHKVLSVQEITHIGKEPLGWVFSLEPTGFIVVPSDYRIRAVICYSFDNNISLTGHTPLLDVLRTDLDYRHDAFDKMPQDLLISYQTLWRDLLHDPVSLLRTLDYTEHGPWLTTNWSQGSPYNAYCPMDPSTGAQTITGCVPTAIAMIMNYWEYPYSLNLTSADNYVSNRTSPPININAASANLDTIEYNQPGGSSPSMDMIARLMFACGVSVQALYSSSATSADVSSDHYTRKWGFTRAYNSTPLSSSFYRDMANDQIAGNRLICPCIAMKADTRLLLTVTIIPVNTTLIWVGQVVITAGMHLKPICPTPIALLQELSLVLQLRLMKTSLIHVVVQNSCNHPGSIKRSLIQFLQPQIPTGSNSLPHRILFTFSTLLVPLI